MPAKQEIGSILIWPSSLKASTLATNLKIMLRALKIAVFLAVVLPIYGEEKSSQPGNDQKNAEDARKLTEPPRTAICTVEDNGTTIKCNWAETKPETYLKRLFSPESTPNIALFFVGLGGIIVAVITLLKLERQTKATEDSVRAFVVAQGPQIWVTGHGNPPKDLFSDTPRVQLELTNKGPTVADDLTYEWWIEILPSELSDFTDKARYYKLEDKTSLYPAQSPMVVNIPLGRSLDERERDQIRKLKSKACVRIKVTYRDTFSTKLLYANFGYWFHPEGIGYLPKYNDRGIANNERQKTN